MYKIALFGAGRIAAVHAENIVRHGQCQLCYIVDPVESAAQNLAKRYNAKVTDLDSALNDPTINGVLIASSTDTHADLIELSAKAGKAIFCEKPVDLNLERVRHCLQIVNQHNSSLLIGFNRRFDSQFSTLKQRYQQGHIGKAETLLIISRDPSPPPVEYIQRSGGLFRDMMIHDLDMTRFILDEEPDSITATGSCLVNPAIGQQGDIDTATVVLTFPSGKQAIILNSRQSGYGYDQRIELHGEKGLLRANNILENYVEQYSAESMRSAIPLDFFLQRYADAYRIEWQHFVDMMAGKTKACVTGLDGEKALRLADAAQSSLQQGKTIKLS